VLSLKSLTFGPSLYENRQDFRLQGLGPGTRERGVSGVLVYTSRIIGLSSLDSHRLSRCLISVKRRLRNEINLTVARAYSLCGN